MEVRFFATFRNLTRGCKARHDIQAETLQQLLEILSCTYGPKFRSRVLDGDELHPDVLIMVNGTHVAHLQGLETPLQQGDVVAIFPKIMGG